MGRTGSIGGLLVVLILSLRRYALYGGDGVATQSLCRVPSRGNGNAYKVISSYLMPHVPSSSG